MEYSFKILFVLSILISLTGGFEITTNQELSNFHSLRIDSPLVYEDKSRFLQTSQKLTFIECKKSTSGLYVANLKLGSEGQLLSMLFDLYSPIVVVPSILCPNSQCTGTKFNQSKSLSYKTIPNS